MFTLQETFDMSCLALVEQGEPGYASGCRYLTEDGRRCAAGHLMTAPREILLGERCGCKHPQVVSLLEGYNLDLVAELQQAHDASAWRTASGLNEAGWSPAQWCSDWLRRVTGVAREFGLATTRVLDAARAKGWQIPKGLS